MKTISLVLVCLYIIPTAAADPASYDAGHRTSAPHPWAPHKPSAPLQPSPPKPGAAVNEAALASPSVGKPPAMAPPPAADVEFYFKTGIQEYRDQRYERAVSSLAHYISLSPKSPQRAAVLVLIGKSLQEMNRVESALEIFGRIIEQYPDRPEALLSMIAMADIGVASAALNYPIGKRGSEYVRDPIVAYEDARMKKISNPIAEHVQYQKGRFFWKTGRYKESCTVQKALLKDFPETGYRKEAADMIKASTVALLHRYHERGDFISMATLFLEAREDDLIGVGDVALTAKGMVSLSRLGLHETARNILDAMQAGARRTIAAEIEKIKAEIGKAGGIGALEPSGSDIKWGLFESARTALRNDDAPLADKALSSLKETGKEPFWSKVTEYLIEENRWTRKYQDILKKKKAGSGPK